MWAASYNSVVNHGAWCPACVGLERRTLEYLNGVAAGRLGVVVDLDYRGVDWKYVWRCKDGHEWKARASDVVAGSWCPVCSGREGNFLERMQGVANSKGGECLSREYVKCDSKYLWKCKDGHEWSSKALNVVNKGRWCPACSKKESQLERDVMAFVKGYVVDVIKVRGVLSNKRFELDVYSPSLRIAVEVDGQRWHHSDWAISHGANVRDARKSLECKNAGIELFRVSEVEWPAVKDRLTIFLSEQLSRKRYSNVA
jgi:hypothetical protein